MHDQLQLSPEEMRQLGYSVIDMLVEHTYSLQNKSIGKKASPEVLKQMIDSTIPYKGKAPEKVLQEVTQLVLDQMIHLDHPRQFAWVPSPSNFISVMGDLIASGFNIFSGLWVTASGAAQIELTTLQWLITLMEMPAQSGGLFVSGGSVANLTALTVARQVKLENRIEKAVIYCTDQTHSSNDRALKILNFLPSQLTRIPTDEHFCMDMAALYSQIEKDIQQGKKPFCVIVNAGTTNTGAVDPLIDIRKICNQYDLWMHVDGAYGAAGMLCDKGRKLLHGIALADSLTIDPHKWLFQPYEIGCLLVKNKQWLAQTFEHKASYLRDAQQNEQSEHNFSSTGIQLTRSFRALKLWMSIKVFGLDAFKNAVGRGFDLAAYAESKLREIADWQIVTPARLGILTFRFAPRHFNLNETNVFNEKMVAYLIADGNAMLSTTQLNEMTVLRMCIINPRTREEDILYTINKLNEIALQMTHPGWVLYGSKM